MSTAELKIGEQWRFRCRPHEEEGQVTIHRVEGDTVHVSLSDVRIFNGIKVGSTVDHLPISMESLRQSVLTRDGEGAEELASFQTGYAHWKEAKGGVFDTSLAEILNILERSMSEPESLLDHAITTMRELQSDEAIEYAVRCALALPTLCFIRSPDDPAGPLLWQYDDYPVCIPIFSTEARAANFIRDAELEDPSFITAPGGEAIGWMLQGFSDEVQYASLNGGHDLNLPLYFDVLRQIVASNESEL